MSDKTGIQWTDATWNPVSGCSKVSPGCKNCYAERDWPRLSKNPKSPYFGRAFTDVKCHPERLDQPLKWGKPRKIFVNSMSDLFHESVPAQFILDVYNTMLDADWHTFQVLTKRVQWMRQFINGRGIFLPNVWHGASAENQEALDPRIQDLVATSSAMRFLSLEPLLGPIDLGPIHVHGEPQIQWVIVGGESGPHARQCEIEWIRSIVQQCKQSHLPVFVKQIGSNPYFAGYEMGRARRGDSHGGDPAEWPEDLRVREFPQ